MQIHLALKFRSSGSKIIFLRHDASQGKTKDRKGLIYLRTGRHEGIVSLKYFKIFLFFPKRKVYPPGKLQFSPSSGQLHPDWPVSWQNLEGLKKFAAHEQRDRSALFGPGKMNRARLRRPILLTGRRKKG
jgi:hypothetical protein